MFRDISHISPGRDFLQAINEAIASCAAMVVVMGKEWLDCTDEAGRRRLDDPDDVLRREVTAALGQATLVIPVLVDDASLPAEESLPEPLKPLARRQAITLTDTHWENDVARLAAAIAAGGLRPKRSAVRSWGKSSPRRVIALSLATLFMATVVGTWVVIDPGRPPARMTGWFNIAVARLGHLDRHGRIVGSPVADQLSARFDRLLDMDGSSLGKGRDLQHRLIGRLRGATSAERAASAQREATRIGADVVVYGVIQSDATSTVLIPEFYVTDRLLFDAREIVGQHQLGTPVMSPGDVARVSVQNQLLDQLSSRARVLAEIVLALGYYSLGEYEAAFTHLLAAERLPGWEPRDGKEILYLLLGNVAGRLGLLAESETYFDQALGLRPDYSRASLGKADIIFQRSRDSCQAGQVDPSGLRHSLEMFRQARIGHLPAGAEVPIKASFGEGRVLLCLSIAVVEDAWPAAEARFVEVIRAYGGTNQYLWELAAEAHANLGVVYRPAGPEESDARARYARAAHEYEEAIAIYQRAGRGEDRQAYFYSQLGFVLSRLKEYARADTAYARAIQLAPDAEAKRKYEEAQRQSRDDDFDPAASP